MEFPGIGTLIDVVAIVAGTSIGVTAGNRLPERLRATVTDALGLVVLVLAGLNIASLSDAAFVGAVGGSGTLLVLLGAVVIGAILGAAINLGRRIEAFGAWLRKRLSRDESPDGQARFVEGFVTASLIVAIGPLAVLGSLADGLSGDISQLVVKSLLDGVICAAFAASLGWGVAASALPVAVVQGTFTAIGATLGGILPAAEIAALTVVGGVLLIGIALRLMAVKQVPVVNMLPALAVGPLLVTVIGALR